MVNIRTMGLTDINQAVTLTEKENWGYCEDDFKRILYCEPRGCFIALKDSQVIGLTTTVNYGILGWIGNVVVDEKYRTEGVGNQLIVHSLGYLKSAGVRCVKLFSYLDVREFYLRLGFEEEAHCSVFSNSKALDLTVQVNKLKKKIEVERVESNNINELVSFDKRTYGFNRSRLLKRLVKDFPNLCHVISTSGSYGYIMASNSQQIGEVGPWICDPRIDNDHAESLLRASLSSIEAQRIEMVVPDENERSSEILRGMKLEVECKVSILYFGEQMGFAEPESIFAFCSLSQG